jgi:hypothetical protein
MPIFARRKDVAVQSFILSLVNQNCPSLRDKLEGPRLEGRVNLSLIVTVVPVENGTHNFQRAFTAPTREFSSSGVGVMIDHPSGLDEATIGFRLRGKVTWIRAKARHLHPMGGGFFQLGFRMIKCLHASDYPGLERLEF